MSADTQLAALLLSNQLTRLDVTPLKAREFWALVDRADALGLDVGALLADTDARTAVGEDDVTEQRLSGLLGATRAFAFEVERLGEGGVELLSALDERFPQLLRDRMHHRCPPHLFVAGAMGALGQRRLGIVADAATPHVESAVRAAVAGAVVADWAPVAAGSAPTPDDGAPTLDSIIVNEARACEVAPILIAADGINRAARAPATRKLVQQCELCLVSPFVPDAAASAATAGARDTVVHAMADRTLVVTCADGTGPTWAAALASVEREPASVLSFTGPGAAAGNSALVELGAVPIETIDALHAYLG